MAAIPPRGKVRELSNEQLQELKDNVRYLLDEGGWSHRTLNQALGFQPTSNMLRNMMYDQGNKFSTTKARFDAIQRLREENLKPGVILISETTRTRKGKNAPAETSSANGQNGTGGTGRTRRRRNAGEGDGGAQSASAPAGPGIVFNMGATQFSATPGDEGSWNVSLTTVCTTEQMMAWTQQVMTGQITAPATVSDAESREEMA